MDDVDTLRANAALVVEQLGPLSSTITASADDVWAFGTSGLARHWSGTTWTTTPIGAPIAFMGAFARAPNDVFAVGQLGGVGSAVAHWDGTTWTRGTVSDGAGLRASDGPHTAHLAMGHWDNRHLSMPNRIGKVEVSH